MPSFPSGNPCRTRVTPPYGRLTRAASGTGWKPVGTSDGMGVGISVFRHRYFLEGKPDKRAGGASKASRGFGHTGRYRCPLPDDTTTATKS